MEAGTRGPGAGPREQTKGPKGAGDQGTAGGTCELRTLNIERGDYGTAGL